MTKKELKNLYYLKKEIVAQKKRIKELENLATSCTAKVTELTNKTEVTDMVGKYAVEIADLKRLLDLNLKKRFYELVRLDKFIESVEDSEIRTILMLRYAQGLSWQQIAKDMGVIGDGSTERKNTTVFLRFPEIPEHM